MDNYKKSARVTLAITYFLILAMVAFVIALPFIASWYVDKMGRPQDLAIITMLSCYPCIPFATVALFSLKNLCKNIIKGEIVEEKNLKLLKKIVISCFFSSIIMIIAGFFYKPFFISGGSALFCSLVFKLLYDILAFYLKKEKKD